MFYQALSSKSYYLFSAIFLNVFFITAGFGGDSCDEPPGSIERMNGSSTFARIREIAAEGVVDLKDDVRIRDNFNRLDRQVRKLKSELEQESKAFNERDESAQEFQMCVSSRSEQYKDDRIMRVKEIEKDCLAPFHAKLKAWVKHSMVPPYDPKEEVLRRHTGSLGERSGSYEWYFGLSATHSRIAALEKTGNLDVSSQVRVRDNLNRGRKQVLDLRSLINSQSSSRVLQDDLYRCASGEITRDKNAFVSYNTLLPCFTAYNTRMLALLLHSNPAGPAKKG